MTENANILTTPSVTHVTSSGGRPRLRWPVHLEFGVAVEIFGLPRPEMGDNWYQFAVAAIDEGPLCATGGIRLMTDGGPGTSRPGGYDRGPGWRGVDAPVPEALCAALASAPTPADVGLFPSVPGCSFSPLPGCSMAARRQPTGATPRRCSPVFRRSRWWRTSFTWAMLC